MRTSVRVMDRDVLVGLVEEGLSVRQIAERLRIGRSAARTALRVAGLETVAAVRRRENAEARTSGARELTRVCDVHGETAFRLDARGVFRCAACNGRRAAARRRRIKEILVAESGGACVLCGYDRCLRALAFHHVDPTGKHFGIGAGGHARSLERAREEARKCVLLCANCHMEVETGMT